VGSAWLGYQNPPSVPESAVDTSAIARVVQARRIDRTLLDFSSSSQHSSAPLAQPFDVVEVEFTPPSLGQPVHAVDAVDSGSVRYLTPDAAIPIRYRSAEPRIIRVAGGARTFRATNARGMIEQLLIVLAMMLGLVGLSVLFSKRKTR
jgi:hypothetical protein